MPQFILKIDLGNDAMQTWNDVLSRLGKVSDEVCSSSEMGLNYPLLNEPPKPIRDINGNIVGHYEVVDS